MFFYISPPPDPQPYYLLTKRIFYLSWSGFRILLLCGLHETVPFQFPILAIEDLPNSVVPPILQSPKQEQVGIKV